MFSDRCPCICPLPKQWSDFSKWSAGHGRITINFWGQEVTQAHFILNAHYVTTTQRSKVKVTQVWS